MGLKPGDVFVEDANGVEKPAAISDAYKSASWINRLKVHFIYDAQARNALWHAHKASLALGRSQAAHQAAEVEAKTPDEARFMSSWANFVSIWALLNPPTCGQQAIWAQHHVLPDMGPIQPKKMIWSRKLFVGALETLDQHYRKEIHGKTVAQADAEAAANAASAAASASAAAAAGVQTSAAGTQAAVNAPGS
jgi:hypothetical protein